MPLLTNTLERNIGPFQDPVGQTGASMELSGKTVFPYLGDENTGNRQDICFQSCRGSGLKSCMPVVP